MLESGARKWKSDLRVSALKNIDLQASVTELIGYVQKLEDGYNCWIWYLSP